MPTDKRPTTLRLPEIAFEKVRYLAYKEKRSINGQIERAIDFYIDEYEKKHGPIPVDDLDE